MTSLNVIEKNSLHFNAVQFNQEIKKLLRTTTPIGWTHYKCSEFHIWIVYSSTVHYCTNTHLTLLLICQIYYIYRGVVLTHLSDQ